MNFYVAENNPQNEYFSDFFVTIIEKFEFLNWADFLKNDTFYIFEPAEFHSPSTEVKCAWIFNCTCPIYALLLECIDKFFYLL